MEGIPMRFRITLALVGLLLFGMTGIAGATDDQVGYIEFHHDITCGSTVVAGVLNVADPEIYDYLDVEPGEVGEFEVPPGTYAVGFFAPEDRDLEDAIGATQVTVAAGQTVKVSASAILLHGPHPCPSETETPSPTPTVTETVTASPTATATATASPSPTAIRTPGRIDTGAGGAAGDGSGLLFAGVALVATMTAVGAAALMSRRNSA